MAIENPEENVDNLNRYLSPDVVTRKSLEMVMEIVSRKVEDYDDLLP